MNHKAACEEVTARWTPSPSAPSNHSRWERKATADLIQKEKTMDPILPRKSWQCERGEAGTFLHPLTQRKRAQAALGSRICIIRKYEQRFLPTE